MQNHEAVGKGFSVVVRTLAPFIARELQIIYGENWWQDAVWNAFSPEQRRGMRYAGEWSELVDNLDATRCFALIDRHWMNVFKRKMSIDQKTWAKELQGVRNKWAHIGGTDFDESYTWRALDTMNRFMEQLDAEGAEEIRGLLREVRYGSTEGSTAATAAVNPATVTVTAKSEGVLDKSPIQGLPSWRMVIEPHPDVAQGRYKNAEFAADLAQVARGEGAYEYRDPIEFFARTYVTEGMKGLLVQALRRVSGQDGEPVIQLKTAFGGGKTHSMLALYHLLRGRVSVDKVPNIKETLKGANLSTLPRANVAVLVGTALDPSKSKRPNNMPGITINTIWGEMAAQLAESAGNLALYDFVKEADKRGVAPGSETLKNLFDACGPCVVLIDEMVAYAKKLYGVSGLPAGSFDNLISFIQEVTEAARASKNSLVVASIPESDIEIGGEAGKIALETIEHTFGRMEAIWKPVAANEGFEIVRRRLFLECKNPASRELVCSKFSEMYNENVGDFPIDSRELDYKNRMLSCYPIHPEVFDRLYEDWATLERFQKTRGVLRLMAAVVHNLWMSNDAGLLIMPGSISMDVPGVRDELTRHLPENWNALVDREVDGKASIPYQKDQQNARFGRILASRRVARTILLGSAPSAKEQNVRGIEASHIRLGVVQPGENIAVFNDALANLQTALAYLYNNPSSNRFWYDTRPTLRKTVEDRATQIAKDDVEYELEDRLKKIRKERPFGGVHVCPASSLDVPDEQSVRLVVLRPGDAYKSVQEGDKAIGAALEILMNRGTAPRIYRNMLAFVAPDQTTLEPLQGEVRRYLAWKSIKDDAEILNLDAAQNREAADNLKRSDETVELRIKETYCHLLVPYIDRSVDMKTFLWDESRISGGTDGIVSKAAKKMEQAEHIITKWAPPLLRMQLSDVLWGDNSEIAIKKLWEYLSTYCYLPRLASYDVLEETIRNGVNSDQFFALAEGYADGRYMGLRYNEYVPLIDPHDSIVRLEVALRQIAADIAKKQSGEGIGPTLGRSGSGVMNGAPGSGEQGTQWPGTLTPPNAGNGSLQEPKKSFIMSARLDNTRINRDVSRLVDEVISLLTQMDGCDVNVSLEVNAMVGKGIPYDAMRAISENCRALKVSDFEFRR